MVKQPTDPTLKKHGLCSEDRKQAKPELWQEMLDRQGGVCGACGSDPPSGILNIDHEHVRGYYQMPPERQRLYHRGLVCYLCNKFRLARGATIAQLEGGAAYLRAYAERKAARASAQV